MAQEHAVTMIHNQILVTLGVLATRKFEDQEILDDLQYLTDELEAIAANIR